MDGIARDRIRTTSISSPTGIRPAIRGRGSTQVSTKKLLKSRGTSSTDRIEGWKSVRRSDGHVMLLQKRFLSKLFEGLAFGTWCGILILVLGWVLVVGSTWGIAVLLSDLTCSRNSS
ncbi:hypothetical protein K439DRAFT_1625094 [Ramaria rubella]|nr:hypothetical protein K439DRAFT_1625094 [Ramaria rubella]